MMVGALTDFTSDSEQARSVSWVFRGMHSAPGQHRLQL